MERRDILVLAAGLAALAPACTTYDDNRDADLAYQGGEWDGSRVPYEGELTGPGVGLLDPWLRETREGRAIVTLGFRDAGNGIVSEEVAHRANIWFRRYADQNCDLVITDPEIRTALVSASNRYLR